MITKFADVFAELKEKKVCKRMVAAWAVDEHTIEACAKASELGFVKVTLVGDKDLIEKTCADNGIDAGQFVIVDEKVELKAVAKAVQMVHDGEGDVLMKGLCSTDKFLRAILNKETGLLPPKGVLSHVGVIENPKYHKLMFLTDMAVIPQFVVAVALGRIQCQGCQCRRSQVALCFIVKAGTELNQSKEKRDCCENEQRNAVQQQKLCPKIHILSLVMTVMPISFTVFVSVYSPFRARRAIPTPS